MNFLGYGEIVNIFGGHYKTGLFCGVGGTLIFHIYAGLAQYLGFTILNVNIFGGFPRKMNFLGYGEIVDIFWGHYKTGLFCGVISIHFRAFCLKRELQNVNIFWGWLKFQIFFLVCLIFLILFGGKQ